MTMDPVDLFGGMSSDDDEEVSQPKISPSTMQCSSSTLMAEMELSDDDEEDPLAALVAEVRQKSKSVSPNASSSPPAVVEKVKTGDVDLFGGVSSDEDDEEGPVPTPKGSSSSAQGSSSTLMAEMELSDDDDPLEALVNEIRRKSSSPPQQAVEKPKTPEQVKFYLSTDSEHSVDTCDIEKIAEEHQKAAMEKKQKFQDAVDADKPVTAMEPLVKRPKLMEPPKVIVPKEQTLLELIREKEAEERQAIPAYEHISSEDVWSVEDQIHQLKHELLLKNMSKEQLERYEVYRSSRFQRTEIRRLMKEFTGGVQIADNVVMAVAALAKIFVGEVVEEALDIRDAKKEETELPLQPHHVRQAFLSLKQDGTI